MIQEIDCLGKEFLKLSKSMRSIIVKELKIIYRAVMVKVRVSV